MDLTQNDPKARANAGAWMTVMKPDGSPELQDDGVTPVRIRLLGKDSDAWIKHDNQVSNRRLAQGTRMTLTAEGLKADAIKGIAVVTAEWEGVGIGEPVSECTLENAVKLYTLRPDIKEQADVFIDNRANF